MDHLLFALICGVWGSSFILMKKASDVFSPVSIGGWRTLSGAAVLACIWFVLMRRRNWPLTRADLPGLSVVVLVGYVYPFIMQPYLIGKYQDSAFIGMLITLVPILTIITQWIMLNRRAGARQWVGVIGGLCCIAALSGVGPAQRMSRVDLLLAISVPVAYAISNTFIKRRFSDSPALPLACSALAGGAMIMLPWGLASESIDTSGQTALGLAIVWLAVLGVVGTGICLMLFYGLIQRRGPLYAGMVTYVIPLGALAWGWLDDETISAGQLVALGGVLVMVALVQWPGRRAGPDSEPVVGPVD